MPSNALLLASDPINTPRNTPNDVSRYVAPFSAALRPPTTRVTKIGLIDPDDPAEEDIQFTRGQKQHKLHGQSIGLANAINQNTFGSD